MKKIKITCSVHDKLYILLSNTNIHKHIFIGYSGGLDSSVLLDLLAQTAKKKSVLKAIHINYSYNYESYKWAVFCRLNCNNYKIVLYNFILNKKYVSNLEAKFRYLRLNIFSNIILKNKTLLLAQHKTDSFETIIINLFRGTGLSGLGGLKFESRLCQLNLVRPLLSKTREDLLRYAIKNAVCFVVDNSNFNNRFTRNYIRNLIYPIILKKWHLSNFIFKNRIFLYNTLGYLLIFFKYFIKTYGFNYRALSLVYLNNLSSFLRIEVLKLWLSFYNYKSLHYKHFFLIARMLSSNQPLAFDFHVKNYRVLKSKCFIYLIENNCFKDRYSNFFFIYCEKFSNRIVFFNIGF